MMLNSNGSIVSVVYAITKRGRVQVYLADRLPADKSSMSKVFNIISVISLIITLGLILAGVMTTLFQEFENDVKSQVSQPDRKQMVCRSGFENDVKSQTSQPDMKDLLAFMQFENDV